MARLRGSLNDDTIIGYNGDDRINGGYGNDSLSGGTGNDRLNGGRGNDTLNGGEGDDIIVSRSDGGEGTIAQEVNAGNDPNGEVNAAARMIYPNQRGLSADDVLTGGAGADQFQIQTLVNAKSEIILKHTDPATGEIDWAGVTGENNLVHDHWVDRIGNDVITDFNKGEGDTLSIVGHTTEVFKIDIVDADGDGAVDDTVLHLRSNQGGAGAHDKDLLGTVSVLNNQLTANDFTVDANSTAGIVRNVSQINEAIAPMVIGGGATGGTGTAPNTGGGGTVSGGAGTATGDGGGTGAAAGAGTGAGADTGTGSGTGAAAAAGAGGHGHGGTATGGGSDAAAGGTGSGAGSGAGTGTGTGVGTGTASSAGADAGAGAGTGTAAADPLAELLTPPAGAAAGQAATSGDDVLIYASGNDRGSGGMGNDLLVGLDGDDVLSGGWGDDRIDGGNGVDHVHGGHGNDLIAGQAGDDLLTGDFGDDFLVGGDGADQLRGGRGEDFALGGNGNDALRGGAGNDILMGGAGADQVDGGSGSDAMLLSGAMTDYTVTVNGNDVSFTDAAGATDAVTRVEQFRFLGSGETYAIENGGLTLTADTADLDEALSDHMIEEMIAAETGTTPADAPLIAAAGALPAAAAAPPAAVAMGGAASQDAVATAEIDSAYANLIAA